MTRARVAPRGYCPSNELRFAIVTRDQRYLTTTEIPCQWDADLDKALLWSSRREADALLRQWTHHYRYRVVQVREEAR